MLNGAITLASILLAVWFGGIEGVNVIECVVSFDVTPYSATVYVDPVFLVWDKSNSIPGSACALGNTIVIEERWHGTDREAYLLTHEMIHVRQCQALGWAMWPAHWFGVVDIEPERASIDYSRPEENAERMWVPGEWPRWYHFMSFEFRLGS